MTTLLYLLIAQLAFAFTDVECKHESRPYAVNNADSTRRVFPDYFNIPDAQFERYLKGGHVGWFISADRKSRLYIVPYTDHSVSMVFLTREQPTDSALVEILQSEGIRYKAADSAITMPGIVSAKGIRLGISYEKVVNIFGKPDKVQVKSNSRKCNWDFKMKEKGNEKMGGLMPFVVDGLSFDVRMHFKNNQLHTLEYWYEVP